jgi:hypothetical protein
MRRDEHAPLEIEGFIQVGNGAEGYKYNTWVTQFEDGVSASIQQGEQSKKYWAQYGNTYLGAWAKPQTAARHIMKQREATQEHSDECAHNE